MKLNRFGAWGLGVVVLAASAAVAVDYDLSWNSIDAGGAMRTCP